MSEYSTCRRVECGHTGSLDGPQQNNWATPNLPSGVRYAVQLCDGGGQAAPIQTLDSKLGSQEFDEIDFTIP
jgi:hypothetical protein